MPSRSTRRERARGTSARRRRSRNASAPTPATSTTTTRRSAMNAQRTRMELIESPLLPAGYRVPVSRWIDSGTRMRELLETEPYLFGPGIFDPHGAEIAMYHGFKAVYFSGYSFAIGHLGTTDMDLYSGPEIADGARRTVSALRKFQLTMALGDPEKGVAPRHLAIPPVVVDMDGGYGNLFNVQRTTELFAEEVHRRFPDAPLAFNWSSSFKWFNESDPTGFRELGALGYKFIFITLAAQHAMGYAFSKLLQGLDETEERAYIDLQRKEWAAGDDIPTRSHHLFTGVPYHQVMGEVLGASRLGKFEGEKAEAVV